MSFMPESDSEDELPPGWEERATDSGNVVYENRKDCITQWTHPRTGRIKRVTGELPMGWTKTFDDTAKRTIFINSETNQSTFVDPRLAFAVEDPAYSIDKVRQRFDSCSTALQVLHGRDLNGRLAVITGANCGIGFETARSLALHACNVIFACRNRKSAEEAIEKIAQERPAARVRCQIMLLDLSSLASVAKFVNELKASVQHIDYLILNAGVFGLPYTTTVDGIEATFQISHLSHFYLTVQLKNLLNHESRVVVLSSESHRMSNLPADNLTELHLSPPKEKYWSMMAYNNAKLCNVLFATELANRWKQKGISVFSVHPGNMISTKIQRNWWFYRFLFAIVRPFTKSLQQGAATSVYCATAPELSGLTGYYFNNCFFCEPSKLSQNKKLSEQLWKISEQMIEASVEKQTLN